MRHIAPKEEENEPVEPHVCTLADTREGFQVGESHVCTMSVSRESFQVVDESSV